MFADMGHPIPGSIGLVVRMGVLYINLVAYEAKTRVRKNTLRCKASQELISKVPNMRLHISGERYVH
jgi:hypothetical protein